MNTALKSENLTAPDANYIVYKHTSPSGKVYIGITRNKPQKRWKGGHGYVNNVHFFRAITRYGWENIKHEILFSDLTEKQALNKEKELIAYYDSTNPDKGYNSDPGGGIRSCETAAKISAALTGVPHDEERRKRQSETRKGTKLTEEHKKRISAGHKQNPKIQAHILALNKARKDQPKSAEQRRKIALSQPKRRAVLNVDTGEIFLSLHDAAKACGGAHPNISKACAGKRQKAYGYRWAYIAERGSV